MMGVDSIACDTLAGSTVRGFKRQTLRPTTKTKLIFLLHPVQGQDDKPQWLVLERQRNLARIAARSPHHDFAAAALGDAGKLIAPLDQDNAVRCRDFIQAERVQLALLLDAVEIEMVEHHRLV